MEPEFPTLNMSIGEYYKLLQANRGRVTRRKAAEVTENKKKEASCSEPKKAELPPRPPSKKSAAKAPKEEKVAEPPKKRPVPESKEKKGAEKSPPSKVKKVKEERDHPKSSHPPATSSDKQKAMQRYSQRFPDGVYRVNVTGRIACIKMKKKGDSSSSAQNIYVKFAENKEGDSYIVEHMDPNNMSKKKEPLVRETVSLKQEKVYLVIEPAWLCYSFSKPAYQPVLVLLNIGRTDIEDLQLPEQEFPSDAKEVASTEKQTIFSADQKLYIMNPTTYALVKCSTELLFQYTPTDTSIRQDCVKKGHATTKLLNELDAFYELDQEWLSSHEKVEVVPSQIQECLFREVIFDNKKGVLLFYNPRSQGLAIRVYSNSSETQTAPQIEWIYLNDPQRPKICANILKGRITLLELENYDPSEDEKKHSYIPQYKYCDIQEEEEFHNSLSEPDKLIKRCKSCNYVLDKLEYRYCGKCESYYHKQCLPAETHKTASRDKTWRCQNCNRCSICLSPKDRKKMITCATCNTCFHVRCLEPNILSQMPSTSKGVVLWKCDRCAKCTSCGATSAGKSKNSKWSHDYTLCSKCKKKRINNQFCPICEQVWSATDEEPMIQCSCGMWIHKSCDRVLTDEIFTKYSASNREYVCPKCRKAKRNQFILQIIEILVEEDKMRIFYNPVDPAFAPNYNTIIRKPMCFLQMKEKAEQSLYLKDPELFKEDFELICKNSMLFNLPKTNYYKEAESLLNRGKLILENNWSTLENFKLMTEEEEAFARMISEKRKQRKNAISSPQSLRPISTKSEIKREDSVTEEGKTGKKGLRDRRQVDYRDPSPLPNEFGMDLSSNQVMPVVNLSGTQLKSKRGPKSTLSRGSQKKSSAPDSVVQSRDKRQAAPSISSESVEPQIDKEIPSHEYFEFLAQREEENSKYLYSNPIIGQFTDASLIFSEMCSLCGAFGNPEDFLTCILCGESYHYYCVSLPNAAACRLESIRSSWKCLNCKYCEVCCKATNEDRLLYCDACDRAFHTDCLNPPLRRIPDCGWKCKDCFQCAKCGTRSFFGEGSSASAEPVLSFAHTNNFTYCNKCGKEENEKSLCHICKMQPDDPENPIAYCIACKHWSHIKCSRLTLAQYRDLRNSGLEYKCFNCLMKERSSQEIHYEVCEAYLNVLNIIYRHSMLADVLHIVLGKYLEPFDEDQANNLLAIFVEDNQFFFKTDPDINNFLQLQEAYVNYEEESDLNSPGVAEEKEQEEIKHSSRNPRKQMRDLFDITYSHSRIAHPHWKMNEEVIESALVENTDNEFEKIEQIINPSSIASNLILSNNSKQAFQLQRLKRLCNNCNEIYDKMGSISSIKESKSLLETIENAQDAYEEPMQLPNSMYSSQLKEGPSPMELEEDKDQKESIKITFNFPKDKKSGAYEPKSINDTFLPERWNVYNAFYKFQTKTRHRAPKNYENFIDMIGTINEGEEEIKHRTMITETTAILKLQHVFHQWVYKFLSQKVKDLKQTINDKPIFEKVLNGKTLEQIEAELAHKGEAGPAQRTDNICEFDPADPAEIDTLIENPSRNLVCCLCKQKGERKLSGRLIPFYGTLYVHVNCAFWSSEVFEGNDGALVNFYFAYRRAKSTKCSHCGKFGASLACNAKKNHIAYHFCCAVSQQMSFSASKITYCKHCAKSKGLPLGLPLDLLIKKRLYIVKNICINTTDITKPGTLDRWKPFIYDSFNRIGNMTVIKLNRQLDKILSGEVAETEISPLYDGFVGLRISWNIYDPMPRAGVPFFKSKAYYLCLGSSHSMNVKVFDKPHANIVKPFISQYHPFASLPDIDPTEPKEIAVREYKELWNEWISGVVSHLPKFSLENLNITSTDFVGITKFPINSWQTLTSKNIDAVLYSINDTARNTSTISKREGNTKQSYAAFVLELKEEVFDNIIKMNEEFGPKSTQYAGYKRTPTSIFQGKIGVRDVGPPAPPVKEAKVSKRFKPKEVIYESKNVKTNVKDVDLPIAMKYRNYRAIPRKVEMAPSRIHKNGLFATDDFMVGEIVVEYVGELIRNKVSDKREKIYEAKGFGDCYMFRIDKDLIVDATMYGSKARYLNHCCVPNCSAKINVIHGTKHILIYANRFIKTGEELTYDYHFDVEADKIPCNCGAPNCKGRLN